MQGSTAIVGKAGYRQRCSNIHSHCSLLRHAGLAGGDHGQSGPDADSAVWAVCQQPPELPEPEPRPGCTGDTLGQRAFTSFTSIHVTEISLC